LGFEYNRSKSEIFGLLYDLRYEENSVSEVPRKKRENIFYEGTENTLNGYGGVFYVSRYLPIWRKLYFTPAFYLGYGSIKGDCSMRYLSVDLIELFPQISSTFPSFPFSSYENKISSDYFYMQLSPELTWFVSNHFGLNVQMGGMGINVVDFDWKNNRKQINFNPSFWKLGIVFKI